jgi:hypothetical protein
VRGTRREGPRLVAQLLLQRRHVAAVHMRVAHADDQLARAQAAHLPPAACAFSRAGAAGRPAGRPSGGATLTLSSRLGPCLTKFARLGRCLNQSGRLGRCLNQSGRLGRCLNQSGRLGRCLNQSGRLGRCLTKFARLGRCLHQSGRLGAGRRSCRAARAVCVARLAAAGAQTRASRQRAHHGSQ